MPEVVLIAGMSGSGKNVALGALEDSGYYPVNNLPAALLTDLVAYLSGAGYGRLAISVELKTQGSVDGLAGRVEALRATGAQVRLLFLDTQTDTLVKRFSETRRRHPMARDGRTLREAIEAERTLVESVRPLGFRFDTSELSAHALRTWVKDFASTDPGRLTVLIQSFGFKRGVPLDADLVFDVRCLPNPHYESRLAPLTGRDEAVIAFLESYPEVERMYNDIQSFVATWLPDYRQDGRNFLTVAIGCTGGRHRSVYMAQRLAVSLSGREQVVVRHRDLPEDGGGR
jgi:UPF0042 nucleotide-binding protein